MERRKPAAIDRATALRYMGASGWTPDAATAAPGLTYIYIGGQSL